MVVGIRDIMKMTGIFIISCCAVFVCTLFLNYNLDLAGINDQITMPQVKAFYDAQVMTGKVVSAVSGGCLLITSVVMLFFYIKHYIDTHKKELGILKALGYSNWRIARGFWVFGLSIFLGTGIGFTGAFALMPLFYKVQNDKQILPDFGVHMHPILVICLVLLPTLFFCMLAVGYSYCKLKMPVLALLKEQTCVKVKRAKKDSELPFLTELKRNTLRQRTSLVFFIGFAAFCFSAMMQMSFSMEELSSIMFSIMMLLIGIVLACVTLFLAVTTVVNANAKSIALMRVFGYSKQACSQAILGGYRKVAYIGFAVGTVYQYVLLRITVSVVFKDVEGVPEYHFDIPAFVISLIMFVILYEVVMYVYSKRLNRISIKEIMLE